MGSYTPDDAGATPIHDPGSEAAILAELNERYDYAVEQKARIVEEGDTDIRYSVGDTWTAADRVARAGRPCENYDQLSQYTNQLVNSFRQNPRAAKASPAGDGATDQTAELRANRIRQIEHDSHAQEVYTVAGENGVTRGYGYARIVAEYEDGSTSRNQTLRLKAIPNPNQVIEDPDAESTSGADWQFLFFVHTVTTREFRRDYPTATVTDFDAAAITAPKWFAKVGRIQIAEYWYVTETPAADGIGRPTRRVCMYLTNGVELLAKRGFPKKTEWRGTSIPFAACYGKIVYQTDDAGDSQKMLQSYIRLARSAAKSYDWTKSTELEALALPVKSALMGFKGQADNDTLALVERSTREPIAWIEFNPLTDATGQNVLPLPQYATRAPDISSYEIAAESFRRDIQNALGRYSTQDRRQGSTQVTSGAALRELDKSGDLGSHHFVAHYDDMIRELAVKLNELLAVYDDTDKEISTRLPDGSTKRVLINHPTGRTVQGDPAYKPTDLRMDQGQHTITISTGPAIDSEREANSEFADHVIGSEQIVAVVGPQKAAALIALAIKLKGAGAIGDQMAEIVDPQQGQDGQPPDPRQLQQENEQLKGKLQELEQVAKQMDGELQSKQAEHQAKGQIAQMEIASKEKMLDAELRAKRALELELADKNNARAIAVAHIAAASKGLAINAHAEEEQLALGLEAEQADRARQHERELAIAGQQHQAGMAAAGGAATADEAEAQRQASAAEAERQRQHALQQGDIGHQQALEIGQQAADLAPTPEEPTE